jgi:DNA polymerase/3'-5' exonuclease PolX
VSESKFDIPKVKWPLAVARKLAEETRDYLREFCTRIEIAGSVRREKPMVGDIELVYVPRFSVEQDPRELLPKQIRINQADAALESLIAQGALERRPNRLGREAWGPEIKLARLLPSGVPIDFFSTMEKCFFNYLVCRTGSKESNMRIAMAAQDKGWKWNPFGSGFSRGEERHAVTSEREVFEFVGLPWQEPKERV